MKYYITAGQPLRAEMCRAQALEYYDIYEKPELVPVDALYKFFTNPTNSAFDTFLAAQYPYTADDMMEIKGTLLMREYKWMAALDAFNNMATADVHVKMVLPADPFLIHINDCHDCDFRNNTASYTKKSFCEKMLALEKQLNAGDVNKAQPAHLLANAYYNISYWGNSWMAFDYYRCHGCEANYNEYKNQSWYTPDFFDLSKAAAYYTLAAENSADREFKAKNIFMLAKCEQNKYYISPDFSYDNENGLKYLYRRHFETMKKEYSNTRFFQEAIAECKYFTYYVNQD